MSLPLDVRGYNQFLFANNDCSQWLIAPRGSVGTGRVNYGSWYSDEPKVVIPHDSPRSNMSGCQPPSLPQA